MQFIAQATLEIRAIAAHALAETIWSRLFVVKGEPRRPWQWTRRKKVPSRLLPSPLPARGVLAVSTEYARILISPWDDNRSAEFP
jgi:hypothetical protein